MEKIIAYVTNHGHMDIEWYQPLDTYRYWISQALERLIQIHKEDPTAPAYILDGSVYPMEAVLEQHPEFKEPLEDLIRRKKLLVGPFYTQFDEFLVSGENIILNCLFGNRKATALGNVLHAGYLPDNFGHPSQLPQILRGFDIDTLLFTRGMVNLDSKDKEFRFVGDDGSALWGVNFSYSGTFSILTNNDPKPTIPHDIPGFSYPFLDYQMLMEVSEHHDHEKIARELIENVKREAPAYPSGIVPVFTGCDHCPPQKGVLKTLELANSLQDEIEFVFGDAEEYGKLLNSRRKPEDAVAFRGNLIGTYTDYLFLGAMTARTYLKQMNDRCEHLLFDYAMPLHLLAGLYAKPQPKPMLADAAKKLLLNSTHDSIHGSSLDAVHIENEYRFHSVAQNAMWYTHDALNQLGLGMKQPEGKADGAFVVYSPVMNRNTVATASVLSADRKITLYDSENRQVPYEMIPPFVVPLNANGAPYVDHVVSDQIRQIRFRHDPKGAVERYHYVIEDAPAAYIQETAGEAAIENEFIRISARNNTITLTDKRTGKVLEELNQIIDVADAGDVWDYSEPWLPCETYNQSQFETKRICTRVGEISSELEYAYDMMLPRCLEGDTRSRELVSVPVCVTVTLYKGICRADVKIQIDNRVKDHCMRLRIPNAGQEDTILSAGLFTVQHIDPSVYFGEGKGIKPANRELPFRDWISCREEADGTGIAVAAKGLYTYEYKENGIEIPLLRSVGLMAKANTKTREPGCVGGDYAIEGAQCIRPLTFAFSYVPVAPQEAPEDYFHPLEGFLREPMSHTLRSVGGGDLAPVLAPYTMDNSSNVLFSAYRGSCDGDGAVLRVYEAFGKPGVLRLRSDVYRSFEAATLNEEPVAPLTCADDGYWQYQLRPHEIVTIIMK